MYSTSLRAQLESVLGGRMATPFTDLDKRVCETVPTGMDALDARIGGLPRGAVTEISGRASTGKTSMLLSILAAATARGEVCALVDGSDAFSPASGLESGIDLQRLLWIRCHTIDQTLKVTDLVLQGGGFGIVALDVSDLPVNALHAVPLATWFRFQRTIEKTPTILTIVSERGVAKTCASLAIHLSIGNHSHSLLYESMTARAEIVRNRQSAILQTYVRIDFHTAFSCPGARP